MADAFFRAHSIVRVDTLENLFELPALLRGHKPSQRHRVAVMTTTGGGAASVVDRLGTLGVEVVGPTQQVISALADKNIRVSNARLTDLTLAGAKQEIYSAVLNALLASDHCDLVLAVAGSSAQFQPQVAIEPLIEADTHGKPLASFAAPHAEDFAQAARRRRHRRFQNARIVRRCDPRLARLDAADRNAGAARSEQIAAATALLAQAGARLDEYRSGRVFRHARHSPSPRAEV